MHKETETLDIGNLLVVATVIFICLVLFNTAIDIEQIKKSIEKQNQILLTNTS